MLSFDNRPITLPFTVIAKAVIYSVTRTILLTRTQTILFADIATRLLTDIAITYLCYLNRHNQKNTCTSFVLLIYVNNKLIHTHTHSSTHNHTALTHTCLLSFYYFAFQLFAICWIGIVMQIWKDHETFRPQHNGDTCHMPHAAHMQEGALQRP